jgi:hypothetical protein
LQFAFFAWPLPYGASSIFAAFCLSVYFRLTGLKFSPAANIGLAARLAGHWNNLAFYRCCAFVRGWTYIVGLLFVNLYFINFIGQRFRADEQ